VFVDTVFQDNECAGQGRRRLRRLPLVAAILQRAVQRHRAFRGAAMGNDGGSNPIV
jgi:hypothetical protein